MESDRSCSGFSAFDAFSAANRRPLRRKTLCTARSQDHPRPRHVERVVDQRLDTREEAHRMRQLGVQREGVFVAPARVDE
jgi:hypothetical protein